MAHPGAPEPVKLLAALLAGEKGALEEALARLAGSWGPIDFQGPDHPFDSTDYYEREMGKDLQRRLVSFRDLIPSEKLVDAKLFAIEVEDALRAGGRRRVNIDPGYLDPHKLVLASVKPQAQKIHLGKGVFADMVLRWSKGAFHPFEWTFADFQCGLYGPDLLAIRRKYRDAAQQSRPSSVGSGPGAAPPG